MTYKYHLSHEISQFGDASKTQQLFFVKYKNCIAEKKAVHLFCKYKFDNDTETNMKFKLVKVEKIKNVFFDYFLSM